MTTVAYTATYMATIYVVYRIHLHWNDQYLIQTAILSLRISHQQPSLHLVCMYLNLSVNNSYCLHKKSMLAYFHTNA